MVITKPIKFFLDPDHSIPTDSSKPKNLGSLYLSEINMFMLITKSNVAKANKKIFI
jgi:hypothetical protein